MLSDLLVCRGSLSNIEDSKFLFWFSLGFLLIYNKLSQSTMSSNSDHLIASHNSAGQEFWQATGPRPSPWCPRGWKVHGAPWSCAQSLRSRASGPGMTGPARLCSHLCGLSSQSFVVTSLCGRSNRVDRLFTWRPQVPRTGISPDGSVAKTPHAQCRGPRFEPCSGD